MKRSNELTELLHCDYPVIQAPMLGVTTPEMVAAVVNEGGLGSLSVGGLSPEKTLSLVQKTKSLTARPFAVNLFTYEIPAQNNAEILHMQDMLGKIAAENGLPYAKDDINTWRHYSYREQIQVLLDENISIVSFTFGIPDDASIQALKQKNIILMGTATCLQEALMLRERGVNIIVAQGTEAGGHRGSFIDAAEPPQVGLISLVSQIVQNADAWVIAAGGIHDARTIQAVFAMGAIGVQVGTAFVASNESNAIEAYKDAVTKAADSDVVLTKAFSGRWARGIRNKFMDTLAHSDVVIPPYPYHNVLTTPLRSAAQKQNNKDFTNLWAGQSAAFAEKLPAAEIFRKLVDGIFTE